MSELPPITKLALLLVRPGFLVLSAPVFGGAYAPTVLKVGLTVIVGASMIPLVPLPEPLAPLDLSLVVVREALIGLSLGFAARVLVAGAEFAGQLAGFQLGFSYASLVDPQSGVVITLPSPTDGVFYARESRRFVLAGTRIAKVAGSEAVRSGRLLSD